MFDFTVRARGGHWVLQDAEAGDLGAYETQDEALEIQLRRIVDELHRKRTKGLTRSQEGYDLRRRRTVHDGGRAVHIDCGLALLGACGTGVSRRGEREQRQQRNRRTQAQQALNCPR